MIPSRDLTDVTLALRKLMVNMMEMVKMVKMKITMAGGKIYLVMEVIL